MWRFISIENLGSELPKHLAALSNKLVKLSGTAVKLSHTIVQIDLGSGDWGYKRKFTGEFMPQLYETHLSDLDINCAFCENLVHTSCHKHCMKCRAGTYIHCSPLLPGMLHYYDMSTGSNDSDAVPWYFKSACTCFKRLEKKKYFKNFVTAMSTITIENFELLEGLACGMSAGEKPCRICASVDYDIYKTCSGHKDFDKSLPCDRIAPLMTSRYCS